MVLPYGKHLVYHGEKPMLVLANIATTTFDVSY
jgi:hypothetical protein